MDSSDTGLRLPTSLMKAVEEIARADGTTTDQFVTMAVAEKVSALRTADYFAERARKGDIERALRFLGREGGEPPREGDERP